MRKSRFNFYIYIHAFSRRFYPKQLTVHSGYTFFFISMCVPWELNPRPFALLTQCSTTELQERFYAFKITDLILCWIYCVFFFFYPSSVRNSLLMHFSNKTSVILGQFWVSHLTWPFCFWKLTQKYHGATVVFRTWYSLHYFRLPCKCHDIWMLIIQDYIEVPYNDRCKQHNYTFSIFLHNFGA